LRRHAVRITLSGHLHMQDVREEQGLFNIVTASLAAYPNAYRVFNLRDGRLDIQSKRLQSIPSMPRLQEESRAFATRIFGEIVRDGLMGAPFHLPGAQATKAAEELRDWWPNISSGDAQFAYTAEQLGHPALAAYVNAFSDIPPPDNDLTIRVTSDE